MARPKLWSSDAERMAAKRVNEQTGRVNEHAKPPDVRIEAVNEQAGGVNEHGDQVNEQAEAPECSETLADAAPCSPGFVAFKDQAHVPHVGPLWAGAGRGTPRTYQGARFVLVARGTVDPDQPEHGVVSLADWSARLAQHCGHGFAGWSCHVC